MEVHRNAKLGLAGRFALVQAREEGSFAEAAAAVLACLLRLPSVVSPMA